MANVNADKVLVLDYGSQYNQLITRRIREMGVFSELKSRNMTADEVKAYNPKAIILSGGPKSVYEEDAFTIDNDIFELGIPVLGVCYGMQLMAQNLGGKVEANPGNGEFGQTVLHQTDTAGLLFANTPADQTVLMSHSGINSLTSPPARTARPFRTRIAAAVPSIISLNLYFEVRAISISWVLSPISAINSVKNTLKNSIIFHFLLDVMHVPSPLTVDYDVLPFLHQCTKEKLMYIN